MEFISLRGYCIPYLQAELNCGRLECFEPGCFDAMLDSSHRAFLNFDDHDAPSICSPVTFHSDEYGLGFAASVSAQTWKVIRPYVVGGHGFASIRTIDASTENVRLRDGSACVSVIRARVSHVCITDRPMYMGTGVWPADGGELNPRLARLARNWNAGRAQWLDENRAHSRRRAAVRTFLAPRPLHYAALRRKFGAAIAAADHHGGAIFAHACLSKRAGFDGNFEKLVLTLSTTS
jgi:phage head maturation protease